MPHGLHCVRYLTNTSTCNLQFPTLGSQGLPSVLTWPARVLEPFRFANSYGLFAVMTRQRCEIEFQGTLDGETYVA